MIPIYKLGGSHSKNGINYDFKAVGHNDVDDYLCDGWVRKFEDLLIEEAEFEEIQEPKKKSKKAVKDDDKQS